MSTSGWWRSWKIKTYDNKNETTHYSSVQRTVVRCGTPGEVAAPAWLLQTYTVICYVHSVLQIWQYSNQYSLFSTQPIYYIKLQSPFVCGCVCVCVCVSVPPFFRHDRLTATKFGTHGDFRGGSKIQKSGKCHELPKNQYIFLPSHPTRGRRGWSFRGNKIQKSGKLHELSTNR